MTRIHSYVVRYDSGFAPNPFYGFCTLATCKPDIRQAARIGDWVVGCGSNDRKIQKGGHIVYAMRVTEILSFGDYDSDPRFQLKKPYRSGSRKQSCGDNIYYRCESSGKWLQRDSFHSRNDGKLNHEHVARDTRVDRVLISNQFVYLGGEGPRFPTHLRDSEGRFICKSGIGRICFSDPALIKSFETWLGKLGVSGYQGPPQEWLSP